MKRGLFPILLLALSLVLLQAHTSTSAQGIPPVGINLVQNGDFEGSYYMYGDGEVAEFWVPYVGAQYRPVPRFYRSTHAFAGQYAQAIESEGTPYRAGIFQTTLTTILPGGGPGVRIQAGEVYRAKAWVKTAWNGLTGTQKPNKMAKRIGIHPRGVANPDSIQVVWSDWNWSDKEWSFLRVTATAQADRLVVFVEVLVEDAQGVCTTYIDDVWMDLEGSGPTPTPTTQPSPTITPTPTVSPTPVFYVENTLPVGFRPYGVAVDTTTNKYYVANNGSQSLAIIDGNQNWRVSIRGSADHSPNELAVDPGLGRLFVTNTDADLVTVFDTAGPNFINSIALETGSQPQGIIVNPSTHKVYVANAGRGTVTVINGNTLSVIKEISVGTEPVRLALDEAANKVYVSNYGGFAFNRSTVAVINANTDTLVKTIPLAQNVLDPNFAPRPYGIGVQPQSHKVFVASTYGKLIIIDGNTDTVERLVDPPDIGNGLYALAVDTATNNVWVTTVPTNKVYVYNANINHWVATFNVGQAPRQGIAANPVTKYVMVSNTGDDSVTVLKDFGAYQRLKLWLPILLKPGST